MSQEGSSARKLRQTHNKTKIAAQAPEPPKSSVKGSATAASLLEIAKTASETFTAQKPIDEGKCKNIACTASAASDSSSKSEEHGAPAMIHIPPDTLSKKFTSVLRSDPNPLQEAILEVLRVTEMQGEMTKGQLTTPYRLLVGRVKEDIHQFFPLIAEAIKEGGTCLKICIEAMLKSYQAAATVNLQSNVTELSNVVAAFQLHQKMMEGQMQCFNTALMDVSTQWNTMSKGVAGLMEEVDKRTLALSAPAAPLRSRVYAAPTVSSKSEDMVIPPKLLELLPGTINRSKHGNITVSQEGSVSYCPRTFIGKTLLSLITSISSLSSLSWILNRDLEELSKTVQSNKEIFDNFSSYSPEERKEIISSSFKKIPTVKNQWETEFME